MQTNTIHTGDCLELAEEIPAGSVDLVLTDPPYGTVEGIGESDDIQHGMSGKTEWDKALSPNALINTSERLLRKNGKAVFFAQEPYTNELVSSATANMLFSYRMAWVKQHFANSLVAKEAPVNLFEDIVVFTRNYDNGSNHPLREYAKDVLSHIDLPLSKINEHLGHRKAEHFFYIDSSQFELCTEETYQELTNQYDLDGMSGYKQYRKLEEIDESFKKQNPNVFNLPDSEKYRSNVFEYQRPQSDHHPTQKPVPLLRELVRTFTNPGDLVVDLTAGSGSTCVACKQEGREFIGIEKDPEYAEIARVRLGEEPKEPQHLRGDKNQSGLEAYAGGD
jgi:site-specific DNA-methyltransferase (adenine-specific)